MAPSAALQVPPLLDAARARYIPAGAGQWRALVAVQPEEIVGNIRAIWKEVMQHKISTSHNTASLFETGAADLWAAVCVPFSFVRTVAVALPKFRVVDDVTQVRSF